MLDIATEKGFTPALVLLWCNYVKDTWAAKRMPEHVMPLEAVKPYVRYAAETFAPYNPFYLVSGDTNFGGDSDTYYQVALQTLREVDPKALTALHIQPAVQIPKSFIDDPALDFYIYQSGHTVHEQHLAYKSAEQFLSTSVKRPIINGEPCYEAHGYGNAYGRFTASDVRKAVWHSLLSGANAGITYGAHGIWSFHRKGDHFPNEGFANTPLDWRTALRLPGGWDTAYAKWIFEHYELYDVEPVCFSDNAAEQIRMAITKDKTKAAIYVPANIQVNLGKDLSDYQRWEAINLSNRYVFVPEVKFAAGKTVIDIHPFNTDVLIIGLSD